MAFDVVRNDLTRVRADAVVLPSNQNLIIDGGAGLSVAQVAGMDQVCQACAQLAPCPVGQSVHTPAFDFPAKYLIHTVGPIWVDGHQGEPALLHSAYQSALGLAEQLECKSVALPLLSAGSYGFPHDRAVSIALAAIKEFCLSSDVQVTLCLFSDQAFDAGRELLGQVAAYIDSTYVQDHEVASSVMFAQSMSMPSEASYADYSYDVAECAPSIAPMPMPVPEPKAERSFGRTFWPSFSSAPASRKEAPVVEAKTVVCLRCGNAVEDGYRFCPACGSELGQADAPVAGDLDSLLDHLDASFSDTLLQLIDASGMTDAQVYRRANISRQHFSKIRSNSSYQPTKRTVFALCVALRLSLAQTEDLLTRAGFSLSHASKFDVIVEYFIQSGNYDIFQINEVLFAYDQPLLG